LWYYFFIRHSTPEGITVPAANHIFKPQHKLHPEEVQKPETPHLVSFAGRNRRKDNCKTIFPDKRKEMQEIFFFGLMDRISLF
jgi:hypothetical protein